MAVTGRQLVVKAMQKIDLLTKTEQPSADEINDGLYSLNAMLSTWSNEAMLINVRTVESFPLIAGDNSYSVGTGQDFNTTRPLFIDACYVRQGTIDYALATIPDEDYANIAIKTLTGIPYWVNFTNGYPTATLNFYPTPDQAYTFFMVSEKPLADLALDTTVTLPPGWEEAIIYNLGIRMAPEYGQTISNEHQALARGTLASITTAIMRNRTLDCPASGGIPLFQSGYYL